MSPQISSFDRNHKEWKGFTTIPAEYHISAFEAGNTIRALNQLKDKAFSLTCSFHHPHPPYLASESYARMYPAEDMVPPASIHDDMSESPYRNMKKNTSEDYSDPAMSKHFVSEYYALNVDPHELTNLLADRAGAQTYAAKVTELETCFQTWRVRTSRNRP